jgi:potassium efflux system protein
MLNGLRNWRLPIALAAALCAACAHGAPALPLTQPSKPDAPVTQTEANVAIAARDIPGRADVDERYARDAAEHARQQRGYEDMRRRLDELATSVASLSTQLRTQSLLELPATRIESLQRRWNFYARQLELWRRDQQRIVDAYADEAAQIESRREAWDATIAGADDGGSAAALRARVDEVMRALHDANRAISAPMSLHLGLGRRATVLQASIDGGLKAMTAATVNYDRRLWRIDQPPLWEARETGRRVNPWAAASGGVALDRQFIAEYFRANHDRWRVHLLFAVLALPLLVWLSVRSRRRLASDPEAAGSGQALTRPVSSWLVLVLLGTFVFEADGPLLLQEGALLLAVIPVLRLLPKKLYDVLGPWPYAATGLYVLQRLGFVLQDDPFWHRVHLLIVTLLTIGVLLWILVESRDHRFSDATDRARSAARAIGALAVLVLVVSAILNVIGNAALAEVLTEGTLDSGYIGLALFAGVGVVNAIVRITVSRRDESRFHGVRERAGPLLQALAKLINVAAVVAWFVAMLNSFRVLRPVSEFARDVLTFPLGVGRLSVTLGSVLLFFAGVWVAFWIANTLRMILNDEVLPKMSLPRGVANSIATLSYYAIILFGLLVTLAAAGFELSQFAIVLGALGVGIGLGLQSVVNNFVSGLILMFERPIQPGDMVEVTGTAGKVRDIGMRATTLVTPEGADVVVPNGVLLSEKLINWTLSDMNRRVDVDVGVAYGSDLRRVAALLGEVTKSTAGIATSPEPLVIFTGFGASSLNFGIRAWSAFGDWVTVRSELGIRVNEALVAAGIQIPFPQQDVYVRAFPELGAGTGTANAAAGEPSGTEPPGDKDPGGISR